MRALSRGKSNLHSTTFVFFLILITAYIPFAANYGVHLIKEDTTDFPSYYYAAQLTFKENKSPYNPKEWKIVQKNYSTENTDLFPYLYPPPSLLFFLPFSLVSYEAARLIMLVLNHLLIFLFIYILLNITDEKKPGLFSAFFVIYLFSFFPLAVTVDYGQINLVIVVLICLVWLACKRDQAPIIIAIPLALATILKLYPCILLIPLAIHRNYKAIVWTFIFLCLIIFISFLTLPQSVWRDWFSGVAISGYGQKLIGISVTTPANQSINGLLSRTFYGQNVRFAPIISPPSWIANSLAYILSVCVITLSGLITYLGQKRQPQDLIDIQFSSWLLVVFMIAPISWNHHLVMALPSIYVLIKYCLDKKQDKVLCFLAFGLALFLSYNYPFNAPFFRDGYKTLLISGQLYAIALLWLISLMILLQQNKSSL